MKNKKIIFIFACLLIIIAIIGVYGIKSAKNKKIKEQNREYTPEEEISEEQQRQTIISLYFVEKETNIIKPEARLLNIKELMENPYIKLIELLIEGPKNEKYKKVIPEGTKILKAELDKDCLNLDFSIEFLNYDKNDDKSKNNLINTIVNTVTELKEINKVKITINGETNIDFNEEYTRK